MVYELTLKSVQIKTTIFNPPAKLINFKELSCAIGMAFKQTGLPYPEIENGRDMKEFRDESLKSFGDNIKLDDKIKTVIESYTFKPNEKMDEDSQATMRLGYDSI